MCTVTWYYAWLREIFALSVRNFNECFIAIILFRLIANYELPRKLFIMKGQLLAPGTKAERQQWNKIIDLLEVAGKLLTTAETRFQSCGTLRSVVDDAALEHVYWLVAIRHSVTAPFSSAAALRGAWQPCRSRVLTHVGPPPPQFSVFNCDLALGWSQSKGSF
jgi:hypothetical protein